MKPIKIETRRGQSLLVEIRPNGVHIGSLLADGDFEPDAGIAFPTEAITPLIEALAKARHHHRANRQPTDV